MHRLPIFLLILSVFGGFFWTAVGWSQNSAPANENVSPFSLGLEAFKKGDFAQSREQFNKLLTENPQDPTLLYNLGLVELSDNRPGRAMAYWRKALYLNPGYSPALSGISRLKNTKQLPPNAEPDALTWIYQRISLSLLIGLSFIFFCLSGWLGVRFFSLKKLEKPSPLGAPLFVIFLFVIFLSLSVHNYVLYQLDTKATILDPSVSAFSSPSSDSPSLFDFREGDEVVVRRSQGDWLQVQKSSTAVGWVKKNQILIHSGT